MTPVVVVWAKYVVGLWKAIGLALALLSAPLIGAQAGEHGGSHAAPAPGHGSADSHEVAAEPMNGAAPKEEARAESDAHAAPGAAAPPGGAQEHGAEAPHGSEHASEPHDASAWGGKVWGVPSGIWHAINFLVLFGAIFWFSRKGLMAAAKTKRDATAKNIEEATKLREEMRKKFEDYDARMRTIDAQMSGLIAEARTDAENEKSKLVSEATALAGRMREDAKQIADQEIARARRELQEEQIARAAELAEQLLKANVTKDDQARLAEEFMSRVGGPGKEGRA